MPLVTLTHQAKNRKVSARQVMREKIIILACLALMAFAFIRRSRRWFEHLSGWQKLFGVIAVLLAVLILINPDFLALGLMGDATFFDVFVMALSIQMLVMVQWAGRGFGKALFRGVRWIGGSPGLRWFLAASSFAFASAISLAQKVVHRIIS